MQLKVLNKKIQIAPTKIFPTSCFSGMDTMIIYRIYRTA